MYVEDVNDEAPVFTQQQYSRLGLRETAGVGTSVIVVRATDRDTGESGFPQSHPLQLVPRTPAGTVILRVPQAPSFSSWGGALGTVLGASAPEAQA